MGDRRRQALTDPQIFPPRMYSGFARKRLASSASRERFKILLVTRSAIDSLPHFQHQ